MLEVGYVQEYLKKTKPKLPRRYELVEEGNYITAIDRAEKTVQKVNANKVEETEKQKIIAALKKLKRDEKVGDAREKQLTQMSEELRDLNHYLNLARNAKELVAQLKSEDIEIDRRVERAKQDAKEIREIFRRRDDRTKKAESEVRRVGKELRCDVKAQIEEKNERHMEKKRKTIMEGVQMKEHLAKMNEKHRQELKAAAIAKQKLRNDTIEFLRLKIEEKKQEKIDDTNIILQHYEVERKRDAMEQALVDKRNAIIRKRLEKGAKIAEKVEALNKAKEENLINLIDTFAIEHEHNIIRREEEEEEKAIERRRMTQFNMRTQYEEKIGQRQHQLMRTMEQREIRLADSHHDSEMNLLRKRMERERLENERYLQAKALEREERQREEREQDKKLLRAAAATDLNIEIEELRIKTLHRQPISVLRYLPSSLLHSNYVPEPLHGLVQEEIRRDPIPVFNIRRHLRHVKRIKDEGGDFIECQKACLERKPISNIF